MPVPLRCKPFLPDSISELFELRNTLTSIEPPLSLSTLVDPYFFKNSAGRILSLIIFEAGEFSPLAARLNRVLGAPDLTLRVLVSSKLRPVVYVRGLEKIKDYRIACRELRRLIPSPHRKPLPFTGINPELERTMGSKHYRKIAGIIWEEISDTLEGVSIDDHSEPKNDPAYRQAVWDMGRLAWSETARDARPQ